jgi:PST family polysaccharide transporter/lipopolysaccharide exporter
MSNKEKAINGGKWVTVATVISTCFQFAQVAILARLLPPAAFGIVSVSALIINFFNIFGNLGFANSIIYKQENDRRVLSSLYIMNILLGVVMFVIIYLCTPLIILYYKEPKLDSIIKLASLYFIISYFGQIYFFLLQKNLKFKSTAIIDIIGSVVGTGATILLAYQGLEELSLIFGQLTMITAKTILQIYFGREYFSPMLKFDFALVKDHLRFGIFNVGEGFLSFVQGNSDNIAIGGILGVKALGYYTIASQLTIFPVTKLNPIILQVAYPILARMKEDPSSLKRSYIKILDLISYLNFPLLIGLYVTAESVVPLLYGPGWEETIHLIKIFVFVSICTCLAHPLFTLVYSKGRPDLLFYLNLATLIVKLPLLYLFGKQWGIDGIAFAYLAASFANMAFSFVIVQYLVGSFMKDFIANIYKPVLFCLSMIVAVTLYKSYFGYEGVVNTIAEIIIGGAVYGILTLMYKVSLMELKSAGKLLKA